MARAASAGNSSKAATAFASRPSRDPPLRGGATARPSTRARFFALFTALWTYADGFLTEGPACSKRVAMASACDASSCPSASKAPASRRCRTLAGTLSPCSRNDDVGKRGGDVDTANASRFPPGRSSRFEEGARRRLSSESTNASKSSSRSSMSSSSSSSGPISVERRRAARSGNDSSSLAVSCRRCWALSSAASRRRLPRSSSPSVERSMVGAESASSDGAADR
mmetsp:Transcript_23968/g.73843  ORF Transcript_23968/g.73843 Transcript_23968/m.73843 type:complete len:225 (-) Transcript_23968:47-721(-)